MAFLTPLTLKMVKQAENRVGVTFDYVRKIAQTNFGLLLRYNKVFGFLDPRKHLPAPAYHAARLRGALAADCGTCVEAEINLALQAGLSKDLVKAILNGTLDGPLRAVVALADAVVAAKEDAPEARAEILRAYGEAGLIELSYAMNGAALLPGIKRAMGYATTCNLSMMKALS
ncbi:hypothetical protein [Sulfitobacter mediterraneus]|jgi:alkylhydroperoxidase family enzyme|uniref:Alkylhydroperoxidase family enzyme n=1 Tax=Sulfitobacter mediterraneus TaxID=83219 RepID=A0A2T6CHP0_9RHOB|nr:hypothetical protein [Sulfitobacter mediterraneus]KIN76804.1 hypothetical protein Z950_1628 [Sulfitobacter mediterraneus KCTC 32188]PTX75024.1 hypothetical protein C8N31_102127 [Sulfitobacter mediterraneus]